ncbi:MAG: STAS domain-containing protein [Flavobacteriales bacterium]
MIIATEQKDNFSLLKINKDRLDSTISSDLKAELVKLNKSGEKNIIVDLSGVKYCDSSGLSALLIGNRLCNESEGKFVINSLQKMVEQMITISQLDKILNISENIEEGNEMLA